MNKKIYAFIHIPKSFGSSFLQSIRDNNINNNRLFNDLAFYDIFHWHYCPVKDNRDYRHIRNLEVFYLEKTLLPLFEKSNKTKLIVHIHSDTWNLDSIIPENISRQYILTMRDPEKRLTSAYSYRIQETKISEYHKNGFFDSIIFSNGLNKMVPNIFSLEKNSKLNIDQLQKLYMIYLDDYLSKKDLVKNLESNIGISLNPVHANHTKVYYNLPPNSDSFFWDKMNDQFKQETRYYKYLENHNFNNLYLCY